MTAVYSATLNTADTVTVPELARDSLDGALIAAESLPEALAVPLVSLAQGAFDSAFVTVMIVVAALLGTTAVGIALITRRA